MGKVTTMLGNHKGLPNTMGEVTTMLGNHKGLPNTMGKVTTMLGNHKGLPLQNTKIQKLEDRDRILLTTNIYYSFYIFEIILLRSNLLSLDVL
jgi:hypothetical protein